MKTTALALAGLAATAMAAKSERTFAVLRFNSGPLVEGSVDPIVDPGVPSKHAHSVQGASNFGLTVDSSKMNQSRCTDAMVGGDFSMYWTPKLYFHDKEKGKFESVPYYYMNVYYFFEPTDDEVVAFPPGLHMFAGDAKMVTLPNGGVENLDPSQGNITAARWSCPRDSYDPPSWPKDSDGSSAGVAFTDDQGFGFPVQNCDRQYSPLRADIHMPSCYDPSKDLTDYKNNMVYPTVTNWKQNCPEGFTHVPHLFYEVYWDTMSFADRWTPNGQDQPFVLSNGDVTGYSLHADFIAGWNEDTLQTIIDTCNAGDAGMQLCPNLPEGLNTVMDCKIDNPVDEMVNGIMDALPGDNELKGWSYGVPIGGGHDSSPSPTSKKAGSTPTSAKVGTTPAPTYGSKNEDVSEDVVGGGGEGPNAGGEGPNAGNGNGKGAVVVETVWETVTVTKRNAEPSDAPLFRKRAHAHHRRH